MPYGVFLPATVPARDDAQAEGWLIFLSIPDLWRFAFVAGAAPRRREKNVLSLENLDLHMVQIPKGMLTLRDDRLETSWVATIEPYLICSIPVTQAFYAEIARQNPSTSASGGNHPVETVSWLDAARFCNLLSKMARLPERYQFSTDGKDTQAIAESDGFRLPTEAEWEFACRAGAREPRYGPIDAIAWYRDNAEGSTRPVATRRSNDWGLHDMLGNVWEWCEDVYDPAVYGTYRIFRGGGWADGERGCLATNRRRSHPTFAIDDLGFRVARSCP
nr:SUMF1/EgtB/PvdO family nonheme iron enzyme [Marinicella sp. W31]MDC2879864.1 SUMF1/EgtB/PvdO family nonheme iron enzyme [Marinicella sp. W31]